MALKIGELARHIATNISVGERVVFSGGELRRKETGELISADRRLNIGTDMGEIMVRTPLATPRGMECFLSDIYPNPDRWGINISDEFTGEQRTHIQMQIDFLNDKLGIVPDNSLSLSISPMTIKRTFLPLLPLLPFSFFGNLGVLCAINNHEVLNPLPIFTTLIADAFILCLPFIVAGKFWARYGFQMPLPFIERGSFQSSKSGIKTMVPAHEYTHFLLDSGAIKNSVIANSVMCLMQLEINGHVSSDDSDDVGYKKGLKADPYRLITGKIQYSNDWLGSRSYTIGNRLAGVAVQLSEKLGDHEAIWEFLSLVAHSDQDELLPNLLNSRFRPFFER